MSYRVSGNDLLTASVRSDEVIPLFSTRSNIIFSDVVIVQNEKDLTAKQTSPSFRKHLDQSIL